MQNPERETARLVAAFFVLGLKAIPRDQIALNAYGKVEVAGKPPKRTDTNRIGILSLLVLECVGLTEDNPTMDELSAHPYHKADTSWVAHRLRNGEILEVLGEFLMLLERAA
jgi:hypothetical protein